MEATALDLVPGALRLQAEAFQTLLAQPRFGLRGALLVVFLAGLSSAIGQSVVLFANRVSPRRFAASLLLQAVLFVLTFLLWAATVWAVASGLMSRTPPFAAAAAAIGLAYAPQLLSFLALAPFLGGPFSVVLSVWTLLSTLLATSVAFDLSRGETLVVAFAGWLASEVLRRTVGRPVVSIGRRIRHAVAGTELRPLDPPSGQRPS